MLKSRANLRTSIRKDVKKFITFDFLSKKEMEIVFLLIEKYYIMGQCDLNDFYMNRVKNEKLPEF